VQIVSPNMLTPRGGSRAPRRGRSRPGACRSARDRSRRTRAPRRRRRRPGSRPRRRRRGGRVARPQAVARLVAGAVVLADLPAGAGRRPEAGDRLAGTHSTRTAASCAPAEPPPQPSAAPSPSRPKARSVVVMVSPPLGGSSGTPAAGPPRRALAEGAQRQLHRLLELRIAAGAPGARVELDLVVGRDADVLDLPLPLEAVDAAARARDQAPVEERR